MKTEAAYPLLHYRSMTLIESIQPEAYPELAPEIQEWVKRSCKRLGVSPPKDVDPYTVLRALRVLAGERRAKKADPHTYDEVRRSVRQQKAYVLGRATELRRQHEDIGYFIWWGWWKEQPKPPFRF